MAAVPVAQPYWKQAVPSAFTPTAFNSLSPEEKEQEKKKMGCCASFCCCILITIIIVAVVAGGALALGTACANDEVCPYKTAAEKAGKYDENLLTTNLAKEFTSKGSTNIDIQVTRGTLTVETQTTGDSKASVVNSGYDQNDDDKELFNKNDFDDVDGVFTSKYEKSGTGLNDCLYCRLSDITLTPGAGLDDVSLESSTDKIVIDTLTVGGDLYVKGEFGGVETTGVLTATGDVEIVSTFGGVTTEAAVTGANVRVASDTGSVTVGAALTATSNVEVYGGAGVLSTLEHSFKGLSGGNVTIKANSKSTTTLDGPVVSTEDAWVNAWIGGAKIVSTATGAITAAAGQVKFYGAGFLEMAGAISASDVVVRADPSADFAFDSVDFTGELKVRSVGGKVAMGVTCGTDKLNVTVTYKVAEGKKSSSGFSFNTKAATPVDLWNEGAGAGITTSNSTGKVGTTNHVDYFEACADGAGGTKQVMVNLNAALGAEVALTEL